MSDKIAAADVTSDPFERYDINVFTAHRDDGTGALLETPILVVEAMVDDAG
jgi:hypothetical protein